MKDELETLADLPDDQFEQLDAIAKRVEAILKETSIEMAISILAGLTGAIIAHVSQSDKEIDANASAISHAITLNARTQRENNDQH